MCTVSNVMDGWNPVIPHPPHTWPPRPGVFPQPPQVFPPPQVVPGLTNEELRELIETYRTAKAAAERADEITGQPDCVDPDKGKLEDRVEELERRLAELEAADA